MSGWGDNFACTVSCLQADPSSNTSLSTARGPHIFPSGIPHLEITARSFGISFVRVRFCHRGMSQEMNSSIIEHVETGGSTTTKVISTDGFSSSLFQTAQISHISLLVVLKHTWHDLGPLEKGKLVIQADACKDSLELMSKYLHQKHFKVKFASSDISAAEHPNLFSP